MSDNLIRSSKNNPCPVCNRTKDSDCRWYSDGETVLCHTFQDGVGTYDESNWYYKGQSGIWGKFVLKAEEKFVKPQRPKSTKSYYYPHLNGDNLVRVDRVDRGDGKKDFYHYHWKDGKWVRGNPDEIKQLIRIYQHARVKAAIERNELVLWVEGESTVEELWKLGITAFTTIGGSEAYSRYGNKGRNYIDDLKGARLIVAPDRDQKGLHYLGSFVPKFSTQIEGYYLAGSHGLWKNLPENQEMDIHDDIRDHKYTKQQILDKVIPPEKYQQISKLAKTSSSQSVKSADNLSANYQQLSADEIKREVETIFNRSLSPVDRETAFVALAQKLKIPKQSIEKIFEELERAASGSADHAEIDKILLAQRHSLSPHQVLPEAVANKIEQIAKARGTNSEPLVLGLLVACSSVPRANTRLSVGNYGDTLSVYSNLFGMVVGDSGKLKSPTINTTFTKPLRSLQDVYSTEFEENFKQYEKDKKDWEKSDGSGDKPTEPRPVVIIAGDVTIEKLEDLAFYQPNVCPALYRDELIGLFQAFDKHGGKGGGDARSKLLSFYDGAPINTHRVGAGSKISKHDYHPGVFGGIQPEVLKELARQIGMDNDGTLCRFLYAPIERTFKHWDTNPDNEKIDTKVFDTLVDQIHRLPAMECELDGSAQQTWAKIADRYNRECLCNPNISPWQKHSYSKAIGQLGKLSLTIHLIECANTNNVTGTIVSATIKRAAIALDYFISQAIALIATTEDTLESHLVRVLDKAKKLGNITPRQVQSLFSGKKRIERAIAKNYLQQLVDGGYGSFDQKGAFSPFETRVAPIDRADNADNVLIVNQQLEASLSNGLNHGVDNADKDSLSIVNEIQTSLIGIDGEHSQDSAEIDNLRSMAITLVDLSRMADDDAVEGLDDLYTVWKPEEMTKASEHLKKMDIKAFHRVTELVSKRKVSQPIRDVAA